MNEKPGLSDEAIRTLLETRAGQPDVAGRLAAVRAVAAATPQKRPSRFGWGAGRTPTLVGVAGLAALVLVLVAVGLASRAPSSGTPTGSPLVASGSEGPNLSPLPSSGSGQTVLTVDELNGLIATDPSAVMDRELVINGQLAIAGESDPCIVGLQGKCVTGPMHLVGSSPDLIVEPVGASAGLGGVSLNAPLPMSGTFAAVLMQNRTLEYDGRVSTTDQGVAFLPSQLPDPSSVPRPGITTGSWLVHGWITSLPAAPSCPSIPLQQLSVYSCGGVAGLLSDDARQPVTVTSGGYTVYGGQGSVVVQNGAYQKFAPTPESSGLQSRPEEVTFLVQKALVSSCSGPALCVTVPGDSHWSVLARLDPIPVVPPAPSPTPDASSQPVLPLTVEHLTAVLATAPQTLSGRQLVITGELVYPTPISSCSGSVSDCVGRVVLLGSQPAVSVVPSALAKLPGSLPFRGTFVATLNDATTLQYEGIVTTAADGGPILPSQLPRTWNTTGAHPYWLVQGWIAGFDVAIPCPPPLVQPTGPQYHGCAVTSSLSDTAAQPVSGTTFNVPKDGVQVQDRAYDDLAPDPQVTGHGTQPEFGTFLVDQDLGPCPPNEFCPFFSGYHWHIVSRIDPWPDAAQP